MRLAVVLCALFIGCSPTAMPAPQALPRSEPPPGARPVGYWPGEHMKVLLPETVVEPCMRMQIVQASQIMGRLAGVEISVGSYTIAGASQVELKQGEVVVVPVPPHVLDDALARTHGMVGVGGALRAAGISYRASATCSPLWTNVFKHEFGHVYGLSDTENEPKALMHWQGVFGGYLRPWELAHLRRRLDAY